MATIKEVSQFAQVSKATVSRVLNNPAMVSSATRARVLEAIESLNFWPNAFAQSLATNRSNSVGVVANGVASPYFGALLDGLGATLGAAGMHVMIADGHAQASTEARAAEFLAQRRADALILHLENPAQHDLSLWVRRGVPVVVLGREVAETGVAAVYHDHELGGRLATEHLLKHGHTRVAYLKGAALYPSQARFRGYCYALRAVGLPVEETLVIETEFGEEGGSAAVARLLAADTPFTALFAANDQMAAGAMIALREAGLEIPRDVSVVGYDDVTLARYVYPPLTTVHQPLREMGRAAARLALGALGRAPRGEVEVKRFEPVLVSRASVASPK